jgi:hypothetical protein
MGGKRIDPIGDYRRWGYRLQGKYPRCKHVAELDSTALTSEWVQAGKSHQVDNRVSSPAGICVLGLESQAIVSSLASSNSFVSADSSIIKSYPQVE